MVKGFDANQARLAELNSFGKDLARRSKSTCELCETKGMKLNVFEVPPVPVQPDYDHCILVCDTCIDAMKAGSKLDANYWRVLNRSVWSEVLPVKTLAVALLDRLVEVSPWASELREQLYLPPETESLISAVQNAL